MRAIVPFLASALLALPLASVLAPPALAAAQRTAAKNDAKPGAPKELGKFEDWIAATYQEGGQQVCYAFTRAGNSTPKLPGRGEVILSVTERPTGRDAVALSAGFAFAANAEVTVQVDQTALNFYTAQRSAFARDGKAAVAAFQKGAQAVARSPGPRNAQVVDTFSLKGFSAAYAAIVKACPAK